MHIISGLLISLFIKKKLEDGENSLHKGFRGIIEVEHRIKGRIRYRVPMIQEKEKAEFLLLTLKKIKGLHGIEINPVSAGVLLEYDESLLTEELLTGAVIQILELDKELLKDPKPRMRKDLTKFVKSLNRGVYDNTNGFIDLYTLVPFSLIGIGLVKTVKDRRFSTPTSLTLIWWAYQTFFVSGKRSD